MNNEYWTALADDYATAYRRVFARAPSLSSLLLAMSIAEHETSNGRAWPGTNNFGAVQLSRAQVPAALWEQAAAGQMNAGASFPGNPGGTLHIDTHPTATGSQKYSAWFAAFPTRIDGIAYFLRMLWRISVRAPDDNGADAEHVATQMYLGGYFEGAHAGARPVGKRVLPLTPPEAANVGDYAHAIERHMGPIGVALEGWHGAVAAPELAPLPILDEGRILASDDRDTLPELPEASAAPVVSPGAASSLAVIALIASIGAALGGLFHGCNGCGH